MRRSPFRVCSLALALPLVLAGSFAQANSLITFETRPGGNMPDDNTPLGNPYSIEGGSVRFFFDVNGNNTFDDGIDARPVFEARGNADGEPHGFQSGQGSLADLGATPELSAQLGAWFVRAPGDPRNTPLPGPFIIDYDTTRTIDSLSGEIWDIDGLPDWFEQWHVDVLDRNNNVVAQQISPRGVDYTLDSRPWTFGFTNLTALSSQVDKVRLTFSQSPDAKTTNIGLAFNNFSAFTSLAPTPVPEPGTLLLSGIGLAGIAVARARRLSRVRREG